MARRQIYVDNGSVGLSEAALKALNTGSYGQLSNRKQQYRTSQEQVNSIPKLPMLDGMGASFSSDNNWESSFGRNKSSIDIDRARRNYAEKYAEEQAQNNINDDSYVVKRDRYNKLMKDNRLANDIKLLAEVNYKNANQSADVREEWANEYGAKKITGGYNKQDFVKTLSRRYGLTPEELNDMALTFHSDAYKKETEQYGKDLEKLGQEHSVLGSAGSFVGTLGSGVEGLYNAAMGAITDDDRYLSNIFRTTKNSPREGVKKNIKTEGGKLAYDVTMGIGDMGVGAAAGSAPVVLAGNTANEAINSAVGRGSSARKASAYGTAAGILDYFTNKVGLEKAKELAVNSIKSTGIKQFLAKNAMAGLGEGAENIIQDIGQSLLDEFLNGTNAELSSAYLAKVQNGESETQALSDVLKDYAKQLGVSGLIGFGMGSAMQGAKSVFGKVPEVVPENKVSDTQTANKLPELGGNTTPKNSVVDINSLPDVEKPGFIQSIKDKAKKAYSDFVSKTDNPSIVKNQVRLTTVPQKLADMLYQASGGTKDISGKYLAIELGKLKHEITNHSDAGKETSRNQIAYNEDIIDKVIDASIDPDIVENISNGLAGNQRDAFAIVKKDTGYIVVVENIGGKNNPHIVPEEIIHMSTDKLDNALASGKSISDIVYENSNRVGDVTGNAEDIKNRVTTVTDAIPETESPSYTSETPPRSPLSNSNVEQTGENVNRLMDNPIENHPRYKKPLEGAELEKADLQRKFNQDAITRLKNEISVLEKDPKNLYRGNLKKAVQAEIKAKKAEISKLQADNRGLEKQIKGGITPVKDVLTAEQKNNIYDTSGKYDSVFSQINLATKFAGDTPEAKDLAKQAQAAIREFINTGSDDSVRELTMALMELDNLAKTTNATYTTKKGNKLTYESRFGEQAQYLSRLQPVADIYNSEKRIAKQNAQSAPEAPAPKAPQNPRLQEIDDNLARIDEKLKQYGGSETNTDLEKYHADIRAIDERLERLKDGVLPYEELVKSSANIPEAINDLYSRRAMLSTQLDQIQDGMTTTLPSGREHRLTAQELADHRANIRYLIKQTDNQIIDNTNRFLLATREAARNNLENASAPIEDALSGNVRRQLEQTRERLLKERQSLQNGGGDNGNEPPRVPEAPTEDINRIPTEEAPVNNGGDNVPPSKPPVPPEEPPAPENDISRRYDTLKKSDLFTKSEENMKMLENAKEKGVFNKDVESRKKSQEEALNEYLADEEGVTQKNFEKDWDSGKDVDTAMLVLHDALDSGSQAYTNLALLKQAIQGKKAGRVLRGMRDYAYSGTKEGTLSKVGDYLVDKAEKVLNNKKTGAEYKTMAEKAKSGDMSFIKKLDMDETNANRIREAIANGASEQDIATMLAMYKAVGTTGVSQEALDKVSELYKKIETVPPTSKARADLEADVFKVLAQDVGGKRTWHEQWDAWRYLAMLGNPKTHLRNILGNTTHRMVTETKDIIGAIIEEAADRYSKNKGGQGIERTKALLDAKDKGLVDRAVQDADDVAYASLNDMGNKYNVKNEISRARNSFNNEKLSKIDDFNSNLLDLEDYTALKKKYSKSLARFLKANGADERIFDATDDASKALLEKGRAYAVDQAKQATFHEYSKLAEALTEFSQKMQGSDTAGRKAVGYVLEGLVPFKKTPINILKQGIKYSPVELVKSVGKMYKAIKGGVDPSEAIESLASGLTGSGIYALGAFLASQGLLTGGQDDNYTVDNAQTEQGEQNYALKIGDNSYTLDWLAPMALPLFAGVETFNYFDKMKKGDEVDPFDAIVDGLSTIAEPITEMSMLQGINNTLENLSYSGLKSAIGTFGTSALTGYLTQGVPTLAGQFARAIDDTRRSTYTDKDNPVKRQLDKTATKIENKLPFLSKTNEPYVDSRGQVQQNEGLASYFLGNNFGTRLLDQMVSPGYFKHGTVDDVDKELNRLYEIDSENPVYRKVSNGKIGDVRLSKEDFTKYQTLYGQTTDELYQDIIKSDAYQNLDDAQKIKMLQGAQGIAKNLSDSDIGGKSLDKTAQKLVDLYKNEGADAVTSYLAEDVAAKALDMNHDTYVKKQAEYPGGAEAYAADRDKAKQLGLNTSTYTSQQQNNPNGAEGYLEDRQAAIDYGFVKKDGSVNTESYENARKLFGNDDAAIRKSQELKKNGITRAADKIPELINDNSLSNEAKGKLLVGDAKSLTGAKKEMYNMGGYEGAYYYYLIKSQADADGNGSVKKAERTAYFEGESQYLDDLWALNQDMYMYLMNNLK